MHGMTPNIWESVQYPIWTCQIRQIMRALSRRNKSLSACIFQCIVRCFLFICPAMRTTSNILISKYNTDLIPTTITSTIPTSFNFWNYSLKSLDNSKWSGHSRNSCSFLFSSPAAPPKYSPRDFLYTPMNIPNVIVFEFCPISPPPGCPYHPPQASSIYIYTPPKSPQTQQKVQSSTVSPPCDQWNWG